MIDKPIKFDFFYNPKDVTTPILLVHCKSTGSRPLALLSLLLKLFYFRRRFSHFFLPLPV